MLIVCVHAKIICSAPINVQENIWQKYTNYGEHCAQLAPFTNGADFSFPNALVQSTHKKWNVIFARALPAKKEWRRLDLSWHPLGCREKDRPSLSRSSCFDAVSVCVHKSRPTCFYTAGRRRKGKEKWALMALPKPTIVCAEGRIGP